MLHMVADGHVMIVFTVYNYLKAVSAIGAHIYLDCKCHKILYRQYVHVDTYFVDRKLGLITIYGILVKCLFCIHTRNLDLESNTI